MNCNELTCIELKSRVNELYYNCSTLEGYLKVWRNSYGERVDVRIYRFEDFLCPSRDVADGFDYEEGDKFVDCLVKYINKHGSFHVHKSRNAPVNRRKDGYLGLEEFYYALAEGEKLDVAELKSLHIKMSNPRPGSLIGLEELDRDEFKDENGKPYLIYWMSRTTIYSDKVFSWYQSKGCIYDDRDSQGVSWEGEEFKVNKDNGLARILKQLSNKKIEDGALKLLVEDKYVPLGAVVYIYYTNAEMEDVENSSFIIHKGYKSLRARETPCVVDHLTENKRNNLIWALAVMPDGVNGGLGNRRTRVKGPYYFFTVYDVAANICKVQCGVEKGNTKWEKFFLFDWSNVDDAAQRYKACFDEFWDKLPREYKLDKPSDESRLHYWADPERAVYKENPLIQLLHMPVDKFEGYKDGAFRGMATL